MISKSVSDQLRRAVCAIGYITLTREEIQKDPTKPFFNVIGTGFLVRETTVITNRHVLEAIVSAQEKLGFKDEQKYLCFVYPAKSESWRTSFCRFTTHGVLLELDVAFIDFKRIPEPEFDQCRPSALGDLSSVTVGQPIACCGYPYGTKLLYRMGKVHRFGPVLQQGYISAVAPYEDTSRVEELLLDIRAAPGMSGSPVFTPEDGRVVGVLYAIAEATSVIAFAVPLDQKRLEQWLALHDKARPHGAGTVAAASFDDTVERPKK